MASSTSMDDIGGIQPPAPNWKPKAKDREDMSPTVTWPELKRQWISWLEHNPEYIKHTPCLVKLDQRDKKIHKFSCKDTSVQANLYLREGMYND